MVIVALLFALIAGVPLGVLSYFYPRAGKIILRVVDLIQTTPALALLGIIMVFMGAGKPTVIVGLALYSLLPIVRNTVLGLNQVPSALKEAATGMGMTRMYQLRRAHRRCQRHRHGGLCRHGGRRRPRQHHQHRHPAK